MKKPYCDNCQVAEYSNYDRPPYIKGGFPGGAHGGFHGGYPGMWNPGVVKPIPPFTYGPYIPGGIYGQYYQNAFGPNLLPILLALSAINPRDNKRYEEYFEDRGLYL